MQAREEEARQLEAKREERRLEARRRLLVRRRRALYSSLEQARSFYKAKGRVTDAWRTALAKRFLRHARAATSSGAVAATHASNAAAVVWQARYRARAARSRLVAMQLRLCHEASSTLAVEARREPLWASLPLMRSELAAAAAGWAAKRQESAPAADGEALKLTRRLAAAAGRRMLLAACNAPGGPVGETEIAAAAAAATAEAAGAADGGGATAPPVLGAAGGGGAAAAAAGLYAELEGLLIQKGGIEERVQRLGGAAARSASQWRRSRASAPT